MDWEALAARGQARYEEGIGRLPGEAEARQKQLVRVAMAAGAVGLARLMQGRSEEAAEWLGRSAERYRESLEGAPPESWGRPIGAIKARLIAGDWAGAERDAEWTLALRPAASSSPIGQYAALLGLLVLGRDAAAAHVATALLARSGEDFPADVAAALAALAASDRERYGEAVLSVLESFESRDAYLEDVPVADTVLVLEALAERRGIAARFRSPLLPAGSPVSRRGDL